MYVKANQKKRKGERKEEALGVQRSKVKERIVNKMMKKKRVKKKDRADQNLKANQNLKVNQNLKALMKRKKKSEKYFKIKSFSN